MQALNIQFLNQQAVPNEKVETPVKQDKSPVSFKSMLEKASVKKHDVKKAADVKGTAKSASYAPESARTESSPSEPEELSAKNDIIPSKDNTDSVAGKASEEACEKTPLAAEHAEDSSSESVAQETCLGSQELLSMNVMQAPVQQPAAPVQEVSQPVPEAENELLAAVSEGEALPAAGTAVVPSAPDRKAAGEKTAVAKQPSLPENGEAETFLEAVADESSGMQASAAVAERERKDVPDGTEGKKTAFRTAHAADKADAAAQNIFTVVDERGKDAKTADLLADSSFAESSDALAVKAADQMAGNIDFSVNLAAAANQDILSSNSQTAGATGSTYQEMLTNQIQQHAPDFVKAGSIILKDSNTGTINMNLKPESLGNVKISLQVSDKGIEGQITVASKEAFEAFKQNIDTLKQAFSQSGFENASFNLNLASSSNDGSFQQGQQQSSEQFFANKTFSNYAQGAESSVSSVSQGVASAYGASSDHHIDVVA